MALTLGMTGVATAAVVEGTPVGAFATSGWTLPSSDPSGVTFVPGRGLLISDAEVEETIALSQPTNLFYSSLTGVNNGAADDGSTVGWSNEPTGVAYVSAAGNPWNGHLFVTDDDQKRVYDISSAGADGRFGTADDGSRTFFRASSFGNTDPEDVAFDSTHNELWVAGGLSTIVSRVNPGADNNFATAGDNVTKNFELPDLDPDPLKPPSPEGMAYDPERDTIYVLDGEAEVVFELARNGAVLNQINLTSIDMQSAGGITLDPASTGSSRTFYIADRGLDPNGTRPPTCGPSSPPGCEAFNDGLIHVVQVTNMPAIGNRPPLASVGEDLIADTLETVTLAGSGEDGEEPPAPGPLTYTWTRVSGPGTVTLGTPNAPTTTASFSDAGDHVMRLTVSDGSLTDFDDMVVHVFAPAAPRSITIPIRVGDDDAQEQIGTTSNGFTDLESADNELGNTNNSDASRVMTGLRFTKLPVPNGSTIDDARIQFSVDEVNSSAASYLIRGQLAGNAPPFLHGNSALTGSKQNISNRTPTVASVAWTNVPAWTTVRNEGPNQRTPQLAPILQEIVTQPTWVRGNAVVFTIQNAAGNTGRRTAEAKDGRIPPYLVLTFRTPLPNVAPIVNAGADASVNVLGSATLDGTVTDDGKPGPAVTTTWSKVSGPGEVSFANPALVDTTATFTQPGSYTLRLTANDGALSAFDDVVVTVLQTPVVSAGPDRTVTLPAGATLDGTVTDDGPVQTTWTKVSGPGTVTFANAGQVDTTATFTHPGSYTLRLTANDGTLSASDDVVVTVLQTPVVSAGPDRTVTLPAAATLDGTVTDDGPVQTTWTKVSGPGTVTFASAGQVDTTATFSQPGSYTLRLTANDGTLSASDAMVVEVLENPVVSAGPDLVVTLPAGTTLDGTVADDGEVETTWIKVRGPGTVAFANPGQVDTTATFSQPGSYTLQLTADDGTLTASDDVVVEVLKTPVVSAGPDLAVILPAAATLDGAVTDDGPVQTTWSKVSGPGAVTFANPGMVDTTATFSQPGSYTLRLTADDGTFIASDDVQLTIDEPVPAVVTPHVTGALTKSAVAVRERTRFKGTVSPAADGQPVQLQRRKGGKWVTVATKHLTAGSSSAYSFDIRRGVSGRYRYRTFVPSYAGGPSAAFDGPAKGLLLRVYRAEITAVGHADDEFVEIANTGAVRIDLRGWLLVNDRTGTQRTLPALLVRRGQVVRIHSGAGTNDRNDVYLGRQNMWGAHATAVLRNDRSVLLDRWRY